MQTLLDVEEFIREEDVIRMMRQILEGLHQLHDNNIAHLDIKPQNLLLTGPFPNCDVKLCDFGISRQVIGNGELREIMGTADYMAPEILNYEPLSLATDMWSIGVLTYALLTGYTPFTGANNQETYCNITSEEVDFPEDLFSDISDNAKDFIAGLLVKNPSGRRTLHSCLEHPWLSTDNCEPSLLSSDCVQTEKDSGFNSPASSDDETSLPFTPTSSPPSTITSADTDTQNGNDSTRRDSGFGSSSLTTGAYTIENALPAPVSQSAVDNAPVTSPAESELTVPAERRLRSCSPLAVRVVPVPNEVTLELEPTRVVSARVTMRSMTPPPVDDDASDVTSEASSSDRTSDMSWEETEFSYRRLSVAQLTDRVWDCFNEHDFNVEPVRPWENVCTGAVGRAKAMFSCKSAAPPVVRTAPRRF
ncbi:Serine/threonine-protein kinase 17B [Amphibalanus amphitrite]|uniref:Serine/threonine-protein kinase 17B n=2 Tax=Amphibalanus amphitrite TaxID=1232801 RepID=A0A6A4WJY1_AMPAM|nr:Serine/threonine-protein kinase 17B [Amphibalanus amphitrite]